MYLVTRLVKTKSGFEPHLPPETGFLMLAEPKEPVEFTLYSCSDLREAPPNTTPVSERLEDLILSGEAWPPAIALMRRDLRKMTFTSVEEFLAKVEERLSFHLSHQREHPAFLARNVVNTGSYKQSGAYYWVIGYKLWEPPIVWWISRTYFIYDDPVSHFDVSLDELARHFPLKDISKN
jgi:hypothetical protein